MHMLPRNTPQSEAHSLHPERTAESDEAARDSSEIFGSIKSYVISRLRKVNVFTLQWPN